MFDNSVSIFTTALDTTDTTQLYLLTSNGQKQICNMNIVVSPMLCIYILSISHYFSLINNGVSRKHNLNFKACSCYNVKNENGRAHDLS